MVTKWTKFDPVGGWLEDVAAGSETLRAAAAGVETVAEGVRDVAQVLALVEGFLGTDPIKTAMATIGGAYDALISDLEGADLYALPILPHSWKDLLHEYTYSNAMVDVASSLSDRMDPNRPILSDGAAYASFTLLIGADNWMDFRKLLKILDGMFSTEQLGKWSRFADLRFQFDKHKRRPIPRAERGSQGETWDWYRTDWIELVPPVGEILRALRDLSDWAVGGADSLARMLEDLAELVIERADYIRQIAEEMAKLLEFLANIRKLVPYASVLFTSADRGGTQAYLTDLVNAGNAPGFKLVAGVSILTGTANPDAFVDIVKRALGIQASRVEAVINQAEQQFQQP